MNRKIYSFFPGLKTRISALKKCLSTICISSVIFLSATNFAKAQDVPVISTPPCNTPLVGQGKVIDKMTEGLVSLFGSNTNAGLIIDGNLNNFVQYSTTAIVGATSIVSVRDLKHSYASGLRVGFVIEPVGGLLSISLLSNFQIRTYKDNQLQETSGLSGAGVITMDSLNTFSGKRRVSFITNAPFDEVELVQTSLISLFSSLRLYYAFVEPQNACNYTCISPIVSNSSGFSPSINNTRTGRTGACILCNVTIQNSPSVINENTDDYGLIDLDGVGAFGAISVATGKMIPANSEVGFVISNNSGGLLDLSLLSGIEIETYRDGSLKETKSLASLLKATLLGGTRQSVSFMAADSCNEVRIVAGGLITSDVRVYYAYARIDSDGDGFYDCVDKCNGSDDNLDSDGDGIPDACDTTPCSLNAGMDVFLCSQEETYDFGQLNLGAGLTWSILSESSPGASIDQTGLVTGLANPGTYLIEVRQNANCADTVAIIRREVSPMCNNPIAGTGIQAFTPSGETCLLCLLNGSSGNPGDVIDGNLNNYVETTSFAGVASNTPLIGVYDSQQTYPAGRRTGFVIQTVGGILDANLLSDLQLETYDNGVLQEAVIADVSAVTATVITGSSSKYRVSFVTTKPFNAVVLRKINTLSLLTRLRIYYAFEEPGNGCSAGSPDDCSQLLLASNEHKAAIQTSHTGISGTACVNCVIDNVGNIIDSDLSNYANIHILAAAGATASIAVSSSLTIEPNYRAGFTISANAGLLDVSALAGLRITTFLNGTQQEDYFADNALVNATALGGSTNQAWISFLTSQPFNEIRLSVSSGIAALQDIRVYNAFLQKDSDRDGTPDCMDKCCGGPDYMDSDGDGIPDACGIDVAYDASCRLCPVKVYLTGIGLTSSHTYALYEDATEIGTFNTGYTLTYVPEKSGMISYTIQGKAEGGNYAPVKNVQINVHPLAATWTPASAGATHWNDNANWTPDTLDTGDSSYPVWCTDVTIPENAQSYPLLQAGDQARDITFKNGASVGRIHFLKYRYAYAEFTPKRNVWMMLSAPLRYLYSADYHADKSWSNAISPKIFMRYFDVDYARSENPKLNPDNVVGTSNGNFSKSFAEIHEGLTPGLGFALWVNGAPYNTGNFPESPVSSSFQFPRRKVDGSDVQYSFHWSDGSWAGEALQMPRGNDINPKADVTPWTASSTPDKNNRYRFSFESMAAVSDSVVSLSSTGGRTVILGNPFLSHLDFNQFFIDNQTTIFNYYRIWNGERFYTYIGSDTPGWTGLANLTTAEQEDTPANQFIAPMQAFFVETRPVAEATIRFTPLSSTATTSSKLRNSVQEENILRLHLQAGKKSSQAIVALLPGASSGYDTNEDIFKLFSPLTDVPEIYTVADQTAIEINLVDANVDEQLIPIGIQMPRTGAMELQVTGSERLDPGVDVFLIDRQENTSLDLRAVDHISFEKTSVEKLEGRFYLSIKNNSITTGIGKNKSGASEILVTIDKKLITVNSPEDEISNLGLYDLSGRVLNQLINSGKHTESIHTPAVGGVYILKVETGSKTEVRKITVSK